MSRAVRVLFLVAALVLAMHACAQEEAERASEHAYSVQMHLHGSFSEGEGSLDSHGYEASEVGCDVLWWSDHDFRITGYEHVARFGFEGFEEPLELGEAWQSRLKKYQGDKKRVLLLSLPPDATTAFVPDPVRQGSLSLRLVAHSPGPEFEPLMLVFGADRKLQRRSLAQGLTLRLAVFPEQLGADGRIVLEARLSEHAPREGLGLEPLTLRYEISPSAGTARRAGASYVVPVACEVGRWNEIELALTRDAVRGFPGSPGEDNALVRLSFGIETRNGQRASVCFDDLRIDQALWGAPVYELQRELIARVGQLHPHIQQLQGLEVSYDARHLNLFCEQTPLPDYEALKRAAPRDPDHPELLDQRAFRAALTASVVAETHARGGLVSYNHPFGVTFEENEKPRPNEQQLAILLASKAEGADLLEVGYRDRGGATLDDHLWLWDQAALRGLRLVGTGVSDSHGGAENRWRGTPNNFVSWIYAPSPSKHDLIEGLRAGRVYFGDLERFDGTLDIVSDGGAKMGAVVTTGRREVTVELLATGTRAGERVVVVESGVRTQTLPVEGERFRCAHGLTLTGESPAFVRFELHDESGPIALSNPIHFLPLHPGQSR